MNSPHKVLIVVGDATETVDTLYPYYRLIEGGFQPVVAGPEIHRYQMVMHEVKKFFKPEFLNRLDDIIVFHYLEQDHVQQIARMFIEELTQRMSHRHIRLEVHEEVIAKLALDGFDPIYGARPLRREVERQVENPLAMMIVRGECSEGSRVQVSLSDGEIHWSVSGGTSSY